MSSLTGAHTYLFPHCTLSVCKTHSRCSVNTKGINAEYRLVGGSELGRQEDNHILQALAWNLDVVSFYKMGREPATVNLTVPVFCWSGCLGRALGTTSVLGHRTTGPDAGSLENLPQVSLAYETGETGRPSA